MITANPAIPAPERVYFFERSEDGFFHVDAPTAWTLYSKGSQILGMDRVRPRYIGTSNGVAYAAAVGEMAKIMKENGLEAAQNHLRQALEREMEIAKGDKTPPPNFDQIDKFGRPTNMSAL